MKKKILSLIVATSMALALLPAEIFATTGDGENAGGDVAINEENFPDEEFREIIAEKCDVVASDGVLSEEEIEAVRNLDLNSNYIIDIKGIEHFTSLTSLDVSYNYIRELPALPATLENLKCNHNKLRKISAFSPGIKTIDCGDNKLTSLPDLPSSLTKLYCDDNQLSALPALPGSLKELNCGGNQISALPVLPDTLEDLSCRENKLTQLPELPSNLIVLSCSKNQLKALPALPDSLEDIYCNRNDDLASIPNFPRNLTELCIQDSSLKSIPPLPEKMEILWITGSKISGVLDISSLHNLKSVDLWDNLLTGIKLSPSANYEDIHISRNYMSSEKAVTGRNDIPWGTRNFTFDAQKTYCDVHGHTFGKKTIDEKAIVAQDYSHYGGYYYKCTKCGFIDWTMIQEVESIDLSAASYTYDGKAKKPSVTVYGKDGKKVSSSNYEVSYSSGRKNVGKYKATVTFKGHYKGSRYLIFKINPKPTAISSVSPGAASLTVKWKKQSAKMSKSRITGYQYRYSTSEKMTNAKTVTVKGYSKTRAKKADLASGQKYYVQVRTYMKVSGATYYSTWSKAKQVTTR